jgi:hypothetical protein
MVFDFPYLYRYSAEDAKQRGELELWRESWNQNINCKYAIEYAIKRDADGTQLKEGCAASVIEDYGFKRVQWVLANTIQHGDEGVFTPESAAWAKRLYIPEHKEFDGHDGNCFFRVGSPPGLVESFTRQDLMAYHELGMFGQAQCESYSDKQDFNGKVLVLSPDVLKESHWTLEDQLWLCTGGFGSHPNARGRAVFSTCLADGEQTRWDRQNFLGVLKDESMPDWAREKLALLTGQEQPDVPAMRGMNME